MEVFLESALAYLLLYKYAALFVITYLAALIVPLPSGATLMAAAALSAEGYFSLTMITLVAVIGNVAGDNTGYWLSRRFGKPILNKIGFGKVLASRTFGWLESEVENFRFPLVFFSRFNLATNISVNVLAGLSRMNYVRFLLYDIAGEITQTLVYVALGYSFAESWKLAYKLFDEATWVLALVILLFLVVAYRKINRRMMKRRDRYIGQNKE